MWKATARKERGSDVRRRARGLGPSGSSVFGLEVLSTKASSCKTGDPKKAAVKKRPGRL